MDLSVRAPRCLGRHRGLKGPTVVCTGGIHGNEPSGVRALERVFRTLSENDIPFRGELIGFVGNITALGHGERFLDCDLNRQWNAADVDRVRTAPPHNLANEALEQRELLEALEGVFAQAQGTVFFVDLHTSSAGGRPFACIGDTLRNRRFATGFPIPVVLGLEENVDGALLEYVNNLGHVTMGIEAGQHDAEESIDRHESAVWFALRNAGCITPSAVPDFDKHRRVLEDATEGLPRFLEIVYRHMIDESDGFRMNPGYENFQPVRKGEELARDRNGPIYASSDVRVLLPLYQGLGREGYFLTREIRPFWLRLSAWMRKLRLDRFAGLIPGVKKHPSQPRTVILASETLQPILIGVFHLLGFRKHGIDQGHMIMTRRVHDTP